MTESKLIFTGLTLSLLTISIVISSCGSVEFQGLNQLREGDDAQNAAGQSGSTDSSAAQPVDENDGSTPDQSDASDKREKRRDHGRSNADGMDAIATEGSSKSKCEGKWKESPSGEMKVELIEKIYQNANEQLLFSDKSGDSKQATIKEISIEAFNINSSYLELRDPNSWYCIGIRGQNAHNFRAFASSVDRVAFYKFDVMSDANPEIIKRDE